MTGEKVMQLKKLSTLLIVPIIGLSIGACSQQSEDPAGAAMDDTAVHTAEVAAAGTSELMAAGEGL
jgi:hypothetical protein